MKDGLVTVTSSGVEFGDFAGVQRYARMLYVAGLIPPLRDDTEQRAIARATAIILMGRRLGICPEEAVASIYQCGHRLEIAGDLPLLLARRHPDWVEAGFSEYYEVGGKMVFSEPDPAAFASPETAAICETQRRGQPSPRRHRFSVAMAKAAGLLTRNALYGSYAYRMLRFRARGYALRDNFADALLGLAIRELYTDASGRVVDGRTAATAPPIQPAQDDTASADQSDMTAHDQDGGDETASADQIIAIVADYERRIESCNDTKQLASLESEIDGRRNQIGDFKADALLHFLADRYGRIVEASEDE